MKKEYKTPAMQVITVLSKQMVAVSTFEEYADYNKEVLSKEGQDWDDWSEE